MIYLAVPYFLRSYQSGEVSSNAGGLLIWPAKGLILLGFCLLGLQWLSELIKRAAIMRGDLQDDAPATHQRRGGGRAAARRTRRRRTPHSGEPPGDGVR